MALAYEGGDGDSPEDAIRIRGAVGEFDGVGAEYDYASAAHGKRDRDWRLERQTLINKLGRVYDRLDIALAGGGRRTLYFDITEFYGRLGAPDCAPNAAEDVCSKPVEVPDKHADLSNASRGGETRRSRGKGRTYRVSGDTSWGEFDFDLRRSDITEMKRRLRADGIPSYDKVLKMVADAGNQSRLVMVPGTLRLMWLLNGCIVLVRVGIVAVVVLLVLRHWWWALGCAAAAYVLSAYAQAELNYELGARLLALDLNLASLSQLKAWRGGVDLDTQGWTLEEHEADTRRVLQAAREAGEHTLRAFCQGVNKGLAEVGWVYFTLGMPFDATLAKLDGLSEEDYRRRLLRSGKRTPDTIEKMIQELKAKRLWPWDW